MQLQIDRGMHHLSVWLFVIVGTYAVDDLVWWNLTTHPVILGQNMTLTCSVQEHACKQNNTRKWSRGKNVKRVLCVDGKSMNAQKFIMVTYTNSLNFDLIVNNVEHSDLNESYLCSCGFHAHEDSLLFESLTVIYPPIETNIDDYSCKYQTQLFINFTFLEVYPVPDCSMEMNGKMLVDKVNFSHQTHMGSIMYSISYTHVYKSTVNGYDAFLNIVCSVGTIQVYESSKKLQPCEQLNSTRGQEKDQFYVYGVCIILSITLVVGVLLLLICRKRRREKNLANHKCQCDDEVEPRGPYLNEEKNQNFLKQHVVFNSIGTDTESLHFMNANMNVNT